MTLAKKIKIHIYTSMNVWVLLTMKSTAHVKTIINSKRTKLCTANNALELQNTNKIILTISLSF